MPFSEMDDNEKLKYCLVGLYKTFVDQVDPKSLLDFLIQERVVDLEEKEKVLSCRTRQDRCRTLLDLLFTTSNPKAFLILKEAMDETYPWIVDKLVEGLKQIRIGHNPTNNREVCSSEHHCSTNQTTNTSIEQLKTKVENLEVVIQQLRYQIMELENQLRAKTDVENKLRNHINILEYQIKTAASSMMKSDDALEVLDQVDGAQDDLFIETFSQVSDNVPKLSIGDSTAIILPNKFKKLKKLPKYCRPTYDLWDGRLEGSKNHVCIKELLNNDQRTEFFSEVLLLQTLNHSRITNLLGRSPNDLHEAYIVFESSPLTNVLNFLKFPHSLQFSSDAIIRWIVQMASGLEYLHSNQILHRSIFATNILMCNSGYSIKITNFQNATILGSGEYVLEVGHLTQAEYTAPEIISQNRWSFASDVWSFGLTALKMFIRGRKLFPQMTQKDIKEFLVNAKECDMEDFLTKHLGTRHVQIGETLRKCLMINEEERPKSSTLSSFDNFRKVENTSPFVKKNRFEHTIVHKNAVRGLTTLNGILYAIFMSSSAIKCYDIHNGLLKLKSIKLGPTARSTFKSYFDHADKVVNNVSAKPIKFCSNNLKSLASCNHTQHLYVLDVGQLVVFQVNTSRRKVVRSWKVPEDATCLSVTQRGSVLVSSSASDCSAWEYNNEGVILSKISRGDVSDGPWKMIQMDELHFLILHGSLYVTSSMENKLWMIDSDGVTSSGYGSMLIGSVSDIVIHTPSKSILVALVGENRIICLDQYMKQQPIELLNINDGICAPSRIHCTENLLFVGLTSGNIYCFEFS